MEASEIKTGDTHAGRAPLQYSLRTLLVVTALLCVGLSLLFASPGWVRVLTVLCLVVVLPGILTVVIVYGRGYTRTFCIGALFPSGVALVSAVEILTGLFWWALAQRFDWDYFEQSGYWPGFFIAVIWSLSVIVGVLAVGVRWRMEAPRRRQQRGAFLGEETRQTAEPETSAAAES